MAKVDELQVQIKLDDDLEEFIQQEVERQIKSRQRREFVTWVIAIALAIVFGRMVGWLIFGIPF